ncbi:glycosyl hydrolase [Caulobacter radicis]|uniref:glycosyl hydrolase n=1 Tax=Caulobacter radicis TaxID=2172650 RepID=UPI001401EDC6|nr:glycosyl hydrolase [Caulobacter radicis]
MLTRRDLLGGTGLALTSRPALAAGLPMLSHPKASQAAQRLYRYLWSLYGRQTLTGQQEQNFRHDGGGHELAYLERTTGRQPALLGFDYLDPRDNSAVNARAIAWSRAGGVVSVCWHWGAPDLGPGYDNAKKDFDLEAALRPGTPQHGVMMRDIDEVARLLVQLRDANVPVLWRPLHEFSGDWFWWGKHGAERFKALWALMHQRFCETHHLDNLIWVLGWAGQNVDAAWYPGRALVDIAGADLYASDHGPLSSIFAAVKAIVGDSVPICLHENGPVPDPDLLGPAADWVWFMTWHTGWLTDPAQNPPDLLRRYFASDRYVTKDELPAWLQTRSGRRG